MEGWKNKGWHFLFYNICGVAVTVLVDQLGNHKTTLISSLILNHVTHHIWGLGSALGVSSPGCATCEVTAETLLWNRMPKRTKLLVCLVLAWLVHQLWSRTRNHSLLSKWPDNLVMACMMSWQTFDPLICHFKYDRFELSALTPNHHLAVLVHMNTAYKAVWPYIDHKLFEYCFLRLQHTSLLIMVIEPWPWNNSLATVRVIYLNVSIDPDFFCCSCSSVTPFLYLRLTDPFIVFHQRSSGACSEPVCVLTCPCQMEATVVWRPVMSGCQCGHAKPGA